MSTTIDLSNWMNLVSGSKKLSELSIPGTHDSGAKNPSSDADRLTTQTRTIAEQLVDGTRFLDIRAAHKNNELALYHESVSLNLTFQSVLNTCQTFLAAHPREAIIMSVKQETGPSGNTDDLSFQGRFNKYVTDSPAGLFYLQNAIPTLREVRGKIVLFRRFQLTENSTVALGINAYDHFPDDGTDTIAGPPELRIQDQYNQALHTRDDKWTEIKKLLKKASEPGNPDVLFVNFASAAGIANLVNHDFPSAVAADINPRLSSYLTSHSPGRFGIVITDFETAELNRVIVETGRV